jgi:DNA-binding beta-propeller fold protein YncE
MTTHRSCKKTFSLSAITLQLFLLSVLFLGIGVLPGCKTIEGVGQRSPQMKNDTAYNKVEEGGWITVFLNLKEAAGPEVSMQVTGVEVKSGNSWKTLSTLPMTIDSAKVRGGQIIIARNGVLPGYYDSLRLVIKEVVVRSGSTQTPLALADLRVQMELDSGINVSRGDSHSFFVTWDVEKSISDAQGFAAGLNAGLQAIPILSNLLFVACPELDTVYVVRTDKNWVISSIGVTGKPTYIDTDMRGERLYVLASEDYSIKVIDLTAFKLIDKYAVRLDSAPQFMTLDPDKNNAFVLDQRGKKILKVDLSNGEILNQRTLSFQPRYATYLEEERLLAVSAAETNYVYLLNPENFISVEAVPVGARPEGLLEFRDVLLVAESGSHSVAGYQIDSKIQSATTNVSFSPMRLLLKSNQLYVTSIDGGKVILMFPGQLIVSREILVGGKPLEITSSKNTHWLYVGNGAKEGVTVIDETSKRIMSFIELDTAPLGMTVID